METTLVDRVLGSDVNYLTLAGPLFLALVGVEIACALWAGIDAYRLNDSIADVSCGVFDQLLKLFAHSVLLAAYVFVYQRWSAFDVASLSASWKILAAVILFLGVDFCFYWHHRFAHLWATPWAAHVVHHQSEEFNLTVALRQSAFEDYVVAAFYLPLALFGFPPAWYLAMFSFNLLWQFWCHTRLIGRLGPIEWVFNTPSHHRVHHGRNPKYLDKNFAGTLIVWDRLFGTFQPEEEEPVYGITRPFASWNPVWANFHMWVELARDAWQAPYAWDKIKVWFMPLGWRPRGLPPKPPASEISRAELVKYDSRPPAGLAAYIMVQYVLAVLIAMYVLNEAGPRSLARFALPALLVVLSLATTAGLFERKPWAFPLEAVRLLILAGGAVFWFLDSPYLPWIFPAAAFGLLTSLLGLAVASRRSIGRDHSPGVREFEPETN